jgi:choline dehydrogenase-like flavoprotein
MFIDGRQVSAGSIIDADIAIIGAGAAGITLARELIDARQRVVLIESGGFDLDADTQALYEGEAAVDSGGVDYPLDAARLRFFGGSTNHWGGFCRPLAEIDFEKRDWVPHSGWPLTRRELDPYYTRAQQVAQLGRNLTASDFDDTAGWAQRGLGAPLAFADDAFVTRFFIYSAPLRFGEAYGAEIGAAGNITTYLHSNVLEIVPDETARRVERLHVATLSGNAFEIRPKLCVLACGGIENARLLLLSNSVQAAGLGNAHDLVGRFFMEHVHVPGQIALVAMNDKAAFPAYYDEPKAIDDAHVRAILMPSDDYLRREKRLGLNIAIYPMRASSADDAAEAGAAQLLRLQRDAALPSGSGATIFGASCAAEPIPSPDNRVTLAMSRDVLGQNRSKLTWRPAIAEHRDLAHHVDALAQSFGRAGHGLVKALFTEKPAWPEDEIGWGNHHMGTTRMSADPKQGVVDADCRVHGIDNLYVAGSSIFPTGGPVNPTLSIVALTLRLADHLKALKLTGRAG